MSNEYLLRKWQETHSKKQIYILKNLTIVYDKRFKNRLIRDSESINSF